MLATSCMKSRAATAGAFSNAGLRGTRPPVAERGELLQLLTAARPIASFAAEQQYRGLKIIRAFD